MRTGAPALFAFVALASAAAAQDAAQTSVRDFVEVYGAIPFPLKGIGVVYGLPGTGDSPKGEIVTTLKNLIGNEYGRVVGDVNSKSVALVAVEAELPPFQAEGTKINVRLATLGDAKSIAGGTLFLTPLRSPRARVEDPSGVYALAQGPLLGGGGAAFTSGVVSNGALVVRQTEATFLQRINWPVLINVTRNGVTAKLPIPNDAYVLRLVLKRPEAQMATEIANQINQVKPLRSFLVASEGETAPGLPEPYLDENPIARVVDPGTIEVRIPAEDEYRAFGSRSKVNFESEPTRFLQRVLETNVVSTWPEPARVVINEKTKTFVLTGNVRVKRGTISTSSVTLRIPNDNMSLGDFLLPEMTASAGAANPRLSNEQAVNLIREMDRAGLIKGEVVTQ